METNSKIFYSIICILFLLCQTKVIAQEKDTLAPHLIQLNKEGKFSEVIKYFRQENKLGKNTKKGEYLVELASAFEGLNSSDSAFLILMKHFEILKKETSFNQLLRLT